MEASFTGSRWRAGLPPGVYQATREPTASVDVRMDVAAFVGLAERGPVREAVGIDAWSDFVRVFGPPGDGRLLARAVQLFFANGGRRCVVVRAVDAENVATAIYTLPTVTGISARAASPGAWGNDLRFDVAWRTAPIGRATSGDGLVWSLAGAVPPAAGTRVRAVSRAGTTTSEARATVIASDATTFTVDVALPTDALAIERLAVDLTVRHADGTTERFLDCGPDPRDARFVGTVLANESALATITDASAGTLWEPEADLVAGPLEGSVSEPDTLGDDAELTTTRACFFDAPTLADTTDRPWASNPTPLDALDAWDDSHEAEPISLVNLPDLAHPRRTADRTTVPVASVTTSVRFGTCASEPDPTVPTDPWPELTLDDASDFTDVSTYQSALVDWCTDPRRNDRVAVLDLPPQLDAQAVLAWSRAHANAQGCAALYAPHLLVVPVEDPTQPPLLVPPGGAVCGAIARRFREVGPAGIPGNLGIAGILDVDRDPLLPDPGFLHEARINLIRPTEVGPRLLGARTTSLDPDWTHLNVRRLMHYLRRQLAIDVRWAPFEPNDARLWRRVARMIERRLRALHVQGAFAGATPAESWFVRCDAATNPASVVDRGQMVALVGVAAAVPTEFLVFQLALGADGTVEVEDG